MSFLFCNLYTVISTNASQYIMRPTDKFRKTLNGEQPQISPTTGSSNISNPVPPTPQQEHRIVLLSKISSLLGWAYDQSKTGNISNN